MSGTRHALALVFALLGLAAPAMASLPARQVSGGAYASSSVGNPRSIVFIHGMFVTPKSWDGWVKRFQAQGYAVAAPAWPLHEGPVESLRSPEQLEKLGSLELADVVDHYRGILKSYPAKPIVIGHSMGGLVAQLLLTEGLAEAAVAIDSAPPKGVFALSASFLKSNWGAINPLADKDEPIQHSLKSFSYAFLNAQDEAARAGIYASSYVPESRRVGAGPTKKVARIDFSASRGPLLLVAGGADHIIPAKLNYKNFRKYGKTPGYTEFVLFDGRDHWTIAGPGWEQVADEVASWLGKRFPGDPR
jgi:pimeloyl-ACP methyl ester carboxylesterase